MLIDTTLLMNSPEIINGLLTGEMTRYGSVIRYVAGTAKAGQIVKHLAEAPALTNSMMMPVNPVIGKAGIASSLIGQRIQQNLSQVMGLSQIATGASVLNVGVSAIGFAYMSYKLQQMHKSINHLQQNIEQGFDRINNRLDKISDQLSYIYFIVQDTQQKQEKLAKAISHLYQGNIIREISSLRAQLTARKRFPEESPHQAIITANQVRLFLSSEALKVTPALEAELMLNSDVTVQGWAVATASEANLLMEIGQFQEAKDMLQEEVSKFRQVAQGWTNKFLKNDHDSLNTAYRFEGKPFKKYILPERIKRISQICSDDLILNGDKLQRKRDEVAVEFEMSYAKERYTQSWIYQQIAIAEYLDTLSELLARLDTLQDFANLCENHGVKSSKDLLLRNEAQPSLYFLCE